jgi:hypothetical protein
MMERESTVIVQQTQENDKVLPELDLRYCGATETATNGSTASALEDTLTVNTTIIALLFDQHEPASENDHINHTIVDLSHG